MYVDKSPCFYLPERFLECNFLPFLMIQRVMPTSFFLLMRFFLRVDGVLIRINDTRLYHEASCFTSAKLDCAARFHFATDLNVNLQ